MEKLVITRLLFSVWTLCIVFITLAPYSSGDIPVLGTIDPSARIIHFMMYFIMVLLLYYSFEHRETRIVLIYGVIILAFSIILELTQLAVPYRSFSVLDIVANAVGIVCFIVFRRFLW